MSSMGDSGLLLQVLQGHYGPDGGKSHTAVEVGCHRGALSRKLLQAFPRLMLFMVDSYCSHDESSDYFKSGDKCSRFSFDEQTGHMETAKFMTADFGGRRTLLRLSSIEAVSRIPCPRLSWVFIDADHSEQAVRDDIAAWWPRVEVGGLLLGHDFGHKRYPGVEIAATEFGKAEGVEIKTLGSIWWAVKPAESAAKLEEQPAMDVVDADNNEPAFVGGE